jgi:hypothetical protein|tara:strand:- start:9206 stop:10033 length:828 start_codon:yes stop_codon:yes gene_type:complete
MTTPKFRIATLLSGMMIAAVTTAAPVSAQAAEREIPEEYPVYEFVCPDGGYQSGCDASKIESAVELERAQRADFAQRCLYRTQADCSVIASGRVNRASGDPALHWQILGLQPSDGPYAEMLVLAEMEPPLPHLLFAKQVEGYFDPPVAARDGDGRFILHVPARNRGIGNGDLVLFTSGEGWNWTSADGIMRQVDRLLPEGFWIASPVGFDFREASAFALVRRDSDAGCCATGGVVNIDFEQSDHSLDVSRVSFTETKPIGAAYEAYPEGSRGGGE